MTFRQVMRKLGMWDSAQRETYKMLAGMSDHMLKDIGLCRGDVNRLIDEMLEDKKDKGTNNDNS